MYTILVHNLSGNQTAHRSTCSDIAKNLGACERYDYPSLESLRSDVAYEMEELGETGTVESYVRFLPCTADITKGN